MADRAEHRLNDIGLYPAPGALAHQPHQRGAVAVISLEPSRPQLPPRGCRLRRSEQPQRPRPASLDLRRPRAMQRPRRFQADHRRPRHITRRDQPLELVDAIAQHRQRHRLADQAPLTSRQPHPIERLARIDRNNQRGGRHLATQQLHDEPLPRRQKENDPPRHSREGSPSSRSFRIYQLSPETEGSLTGAIPISGCPRSRPALRRRLPQQCPGRLLEDLAPGAGRLLLGREVLDDLAHAGRARSRCRGGRRSRGRSS